MEKIAIEHLEPIFKSDENTLKLFTTKIAQKQKICL